MGKIAYIALDLHARSCTLGVMDAAGRFLGNGQFLTSEKELVNALEMVTAKQKHLVIEMFFNALGRAGGQRSCAAGPAIRGRMP